MGDAGESKYLNFSFWRMSLQTKDAAMKKIMFVLVLMMASGLGGKSVAFSNQAAAVGVPAEQLGARPVHEYGTEHQINALNEKNHRNDKRLLRAGPSNEVEAKRLKLMFLLMMSLDQYRTPVH
jgi:hypothetical protein